MQDLRMTRIYRMKFAENGDKETLIELTTGDGKVALESGWTLDYEKPQGDPDYRPLGRKEFNGVIHELTEAIGEMQLNGFSIWQSGAYPKGAWVNHNDEVYISRQATSQNTSGADWVKLVLDDMINPVGTISPFAGATAPDGWLLCQGQELSRNTYQRLYDVIGDSFGAGDGSTTFNLPDLRDYFVRGRRSGRAVGNVEQDSIKSHTHTGTAQSDGAHTHAGTTNVDGFHSHTGTTDNAGGHSHGRGTMEIAAGVTSYTSGIGSAAFYRPSGAISLSGSKYRGYAPGDSSTVVSRQPNLNFTASNGWTGRTSTEGNHNHTISLTGGKHSHKLTTDSGGSHTHSLTINLTGGSETRPKNIALNYIIKV